MSSGPGVVHVKTLIWFQEEVKSKSSPEEQMVGRCFLQHSETMKLVYTEYCINHDKAEQLLEKYDQVQASLKNKNWWLLKPPHS